MFTATLPGPAATDEAQILAIVEKLSRTHLIKDAELFAAQFERDSASFNLASPLDHRVSVGEQRKWVGSAKASVCIEPRDVNIAVSGDLAYCNCYLQMSGTKSGAEGTVIFWMWETLCLERKAGTWRITYEHTSVPFHPISPSTVSRAVDSAHRRTTSVRDSKLIELMPEQLTLPREQISKIAIKTDGKILFIDPHDLVAVEAQGGYVLLKQESGSSFLLRESISKTEEKLKSCGFVRIHRSVLVNPAFVQQICPMGGTGEYKLLLKSGREFTVTRTFKKNLAALARLWIGTGNFAADL